MRLKLLLCLAMLVATPAAAENWKPVPGEPDTYVDMDFVKVDQQTGLVVLRTAMPEGSVFLEQGISEDSASELDDALVEVTPA